MKTNETMRDRSQGRNLHHWTMAAVLLFLLAMAGTARAISVTNVIYFDTFNRVGPLAGSSPDTVNAPGAVWIGNTPTNGIVTDGTEASITNLQGNLFQNAFLPLNFETGHVYIITCTVIGNSNAGGNLAFGESDCPSVLNWIGANQYWCPNYVTVNSSNNGCGYWNYSNNNPSRPAYAWTPVMTYTMLLNLITNSSPNGALTNNVGTLYTNGVLAYSAAPTPLTRLNADSDAYPGYVFIGQNTTNAAGSFQNFSVTDIVLNANSPTIVEQPNNLTASVGHTATFWVRGYAMPDPTYQWMTNSTGGVTNAILGATNATYTTPQLTTAYNGLNYSVVLSTAAGSTNSALAALTVTAGTPTVYSATKTTSPNQVVVNFSGPVDPTTGLNAANYSLLVNNSPGGSVTAVSYGSSSNNVILTTSTLNSNAGYYLAVQNVQDQFGDAINTSTNPVLPAGLVFYLRGDSGVQLDASGNVAQWLDQTTNGNNAQQFFGSYGNEYGTYILSPGARPGTTTIGANSTPAVSFNGGNKNYLTVPPSPTFNTGGNLTMYCFASPTTTANAEVFNEDIGNTPDGFELQLDATSLSPKLLLSDSSANALNTLDAGAGTPAVTAAAHVWAINSHFVGTNFSPGVTISPDRLLTNAVSWFVDGSAYGGLFGSGTNLISCNYPGSGYGENPVYVGGRADHAVFFNGAMGELMLFSGPIPAADRTNVDNYLGQKYFTFNIAQQPQAVTSSNGFAATFNIVATQGSSHIGFQWQENGTNLPGATSAAYTTPALAPADNNDMFDVILTLLNGSTQTSSVVTLTVDDMPPYVTGAGIPIWNTNQIIVQYDQLAIDPATGTNVSNYILNSGTVLSAAIGNTPNTVVLTTTPLTWSANLSSYTVTVQNVKDLYGNTIASTVMPVGLYPFATALWVDVNNGVVTNNTGSVTAWNDLSGNGNNLGEYIPTYTAYDPTYVIGAVGKPAVRFIATNLSVMVAPSSTSLGITGDMSIFAVVNYATLLGGTNGHILGKTGVKANNQANQPGPYDYYTSASATLLYRGNGVSGAAQVSSSAIPNPLGFAHLQDVVQQGTLVNHRLDGNPVGSGVLNNVPADAGQELYVGCRGDFGLAGNVRLTGDLSAILIIGSAMSSNDVVSLENYLAAEYNLPLTTNAYPSITKQPFASTNVYQTTSVSVPVTASGVPSVAYNWYDTNGVAIPGQTSATLSITNAQTSDTYYVVVTNNWGALISSNVAVTVIAINTSPTNIVSSITNNSMLLSWPMDHTGWQLQAQTNSLSAGLGTNWVKVPGSTSTNQVAVPINLNNGSVFLRLVFPPQ